MTGKLFQADEDYSLWFKGLKEQILAALAVNQELVTLYWQVGRSILEQQEQRGWGTKVIGKLAKDLKKEFLEIKGFSRSNLMYMRAFAEAHPGEQIVQCSVGQLPVRQAGPITWR